LLTLTKFVPVMVTALPTGPFIGLTPEIVAAAAAVCAESTAAPLADAGMTRRRQIRPTMAAGEGLFRGAVPHIVLEVRPAQGPSWDEDGSARLV
jgi:hypothetical protein